MAGARGEAIEWVGGHYSAPAYVLEREPFRPEIVLWVELPTGLILGQRLERPPLGPDRVVAVLDAALADGGTPPDQIRVSDAAVAEMVRRKLGERFPVVVAPTPELDALFADLARFLGQQPGGEEPSYLEDGRVPEAAVGRLFRAARRLWGIAPWKVASDSQVLAVDVPALGVEGACLSIIGALGQNRGFVLFASFGAYEAFGEQFDHGDHEARPNVHGYLLSLDFERRSALPPRMRREIARHRWPVGGPGAYPVVLCPDPDGVRRPLGAREVQLAAAVAEALAAFCGRHLQLFQTDHPERVTEELRAGPPDESVTVRLTAPHPALVTEAEPAPPDSSPPPAILLARVGRNDPCPCGSGRKYKRCHLRTDEAVPEAEAPRLRALDDRLVATLVEFARRRMPEAWETAVAEIARLGPSIEAAPQFAVPWLLFHYRHEGRPLAEHYRDAYAGRLDSTEREWLAAQLRAWLSVWEVLDVEPGRSLRLRDLLTGEERGVHEVSGSQVLHRRSNMLARVVDWRGLPVLCGAHLRPLLPSDAEAVVRAARRALGVGARAVRPDDLHAAGVERALVRAWEGQVRAADQRTANLQLRNTDGHAILLTQDDFVFEPSRRVEVEQRIATVAERVEMGNDEDTSRFDLIGPPRPGSPLPNGTLTGSIRVTDGTLCLETNSRERADTLRRLIEETCAGLVRHRLRTHTDPRAHLDREPHARHTPSPEELAALQEFKRQHYARWLDEEIPALGGLTPREAARRAAGRRQLDLLLRDIECREASLPAAERFDFGRLRSALGLEA